MAYDPKKLVAGVAKAISAGASKGGLVGGIAGGVSGAATGIASQAPKLVNSPQGIAQKTYGTSDPAPGIPRVGSTNSNSSPYFNKPDYNYMSYDQARSQAESQLKPAIAQSVRTALDSVKNQSMGSGFFGQMPQMQLSADTQSQIETQGQGDIARLAQQLQQSDREEAARKLQEALSVYSAQRNAYESDRGFGEDKRQYNIGAATNLSQIYGMPVQPKDSGTELFRQIQGIKPLAAQEFDYSKIQGDRNYGIALDNSKQGWAGIDLQRQNMLDDSARGWAGLNLNQQKMSYQSIEDAQKQIQGIRNYGVKYINGLSDKPTFNPETGVKIQDGVGPKTKSVIIANYNQLMDELLAKPDPYGTFQDKKSGLYELYKDKGYASYLINAIESSLSQYQAMGK